MPGIQSKLNLNRRPQPKTAAPPDRQIGRRNGSKKKRGDSMRKPRTQKVCKSEDEKSLVPLFMREALNGIIEIQYVDSAAAAKRPRGRKDNSWQDGDDEWQADSIDASKSAVGRSRRLLKSVALVMAHGQVDPALRRPGCLALAAGVLALIAKLEGRAPYTDELSRWARRRVPGASRFEIAAAANAAIAPARPNPRQAGRAIMLTRAEWFALDQPWGLWPVDLTDEEVKRQQRKKSDLESVKRKRAERADNGMRSQSQSIAALARKHGVSRTTIYAWVRTGKLEVNSFGVVSLSKKEDKEDYAKSVQSDDRPAHRERPAPQAPGRAPILPIERRLAARARLRFLAAEIFAGTPPNTALERARLQARL